MSRMVYGNLAVKQEYETRYKKEKVIRYRKVSVRHGLPVKEKLTYLLLVVLFVALSGVLLSRYAYVAELNYKVLGAKSEIANLEKEIDLLQLKVAELSSPDRILKIAEEMGLTQHEGNVKTVRIAALSKAQKAED